jgi:glycosyltransferase involved in cell wall biosynthesis
MNPLVSVVIPAYNAAGHIADAVRSVLAQDLQDFEILVVNDGSPDGAALQHAIAPYMNQIRYLTQSNGGAGSARNRGIMNARGKYVAFLDADDVWLPNFLSTMVALLRSAPSAGAAYCDGWLEDAAGRRAGRFTSRSPSRGRVTLGALVEGTCNVITSGVLIRSDVVRGAGMFDVRYRYGEDFELWCRLVRDGTVVVYTHAVLLIRTVGGGGMTANKVKMWNAERRVYGKLLRHGGLTKAEQRAITTRLHVCRAAVHLERGKIALMCGDEVAAKNAFRTACMIAPRGKLLLLNAGIALAPSRALAFARQWITKAPTVIAQRDSQSNVPNSTSRL